MVVVVVVVAVVVVWFGWLVGFVVADVDVKKKKKIKIGSCFKTLAVILVSD